MSGSMRRPGGARTLTVLALLWAVADTGTLQGNLYAWSPAGVENAGRSDPLTWLAGTWRGEQGEASIEETWSERDGDNRMGMFRLVTGGTVQLYEFMSIEYPEDGPPVLRIKHFSKGLRGWEEKDDSEALELVESDARRALFVQAGPEAERRLTYTLGEGGALTVVLEQARAEGTSRTEFRFTRR